MNEIPRNYSRDIRRAAVQVMYQFDARGDDELDVVRESLEGSAGETKDHEVGFALAQEAWSKRAEADSAVAKLAPDWPTYRQPVLDRNILRLAHFEIVSGRTPPKVAINEAVELAREFSTEKSPTFVNGVLDKIYRHWLNPEDVVDLSDEDDQSPDEKPTAEVATDVSEDANVCSDPLNGA